MRKKFVSRGDTIIEVVLAFAIFAMAAVGTMDVLSKGVATTQRDLEITLVRQQVDSQAELIRYLHDTQYNVANSTWSNLIAQVTTAPAPLSSSCNNPIGLSGAFYVRPVIQSDPTATTFTKQPITSATYATPDTYAIVDYAHSKSRGIWIQTAKSEVTNGAMAVNAYDFYIHACWNSAGIPVPMTAGTIVRIYE